MSIKPFAQPPMLTAHATVKQGLAINDKLCSCSHSGDCSIMIITNPKSEPFKVQRVSADGAPNQAPRRWNLSLFGGPGRPDAYRDGNTVEQINCLRVSLTFETPGRRRDFSRRLQIYLSLYHRAWDEYRAQDGRARYYADRPRETSPAESGMHSGHSTSSVPSSTTNSFSGSGSGSGSVTPASAPRLTCDIPTTSAIHLPWG